MSGERSPIISGNTGITLGIVVTLCTGVYFAASLRSDIDNLKLLVATWISSRDKQVEDLNSIKDRVKAIETGGCPKSQEVEGMVRQLEKDLDHHILGEQKPTVGGKVL